MNRSRSLLLLTCIAAFAVCLLSASQFRRRAHLSPATANSGNPIPAERRAALVSEYGKLPLDFEQNQGQTDARVKFLARGAGYTVFLSDDQTATLRLIAPAHDPAGSLQGSARSSTSAAPTKNLDATVRLSLV